MIVQVILKEQVKLLYLLKMKLFQQAKDYFTGNNKTHNLIFLIIIVEHNLKFQTIKATKENAVVLFDVINFNKLVKMAGNCHSCKNFSISTQQCNDCDSIFCKKCIS